MNDRELYCRGKASEERRNARLARTKKDERAHLAKAKRWDEEADSAASAQGGGYTAPTDTPPTHAP